LKILLALLLVALVLVGCTHPPQLTTSMDVQKQSDDLIVVKLKVVNLEDHATVPLNVELTGQAEKNGHWDKSSSLLHPAAFVLNAKEQRDITKFWRIQADAVRTTLIVKEQERGNLLKTEKAEKVFSGQSQQPTSQR
jgi:PBP1b-binding outer membrane lipoprotein LpoB